MKAPRQSGDKGAWERTISRYLTANKVPVLWDYTQRKFTGIHGYTLKRIAPMRARYDTSQSLSGLPEFFRDHAGEPNLVVIVTNRKYGDDLEDSLVVMRLGTFGPMFATHITSDRERYLDAS